MHFIFTSTHRYYAGENGEIRQENFTKERWCIFFRTQAFKKLHLFVWYTLRNMKKFDTLENWGFLKNSLSRGSRVFFWRVFSAWQRNDLKLLQIATNVNKKDQNLQIQKILVGFFKYAFEKILAIYFPSFSNEIDIQILSGIKFRTSHEQIYLSWKFHLGNRNAKNITIIHPCRRNFPLRGVSTFRERGADVEKKDEKFDVMYVSV